MVRRVWSTRIVTGTKMSFKALLKLTDVRAIDLVNSFKYALKTFFVPLTIPTVPQTRHVAAHRTQNVTSYPERPGRTRQQDVIIVMVDPVK